ncbi:MAG: hypothetical protein AAF298_02395 [Cyanobacteria bacterium P01_A01_bin.40]
MKSSSRETIVPPARNFFLMISSPSSRSSRVVKNSLVSLSCQMISVVGGVVDLSITFTRSKTSRILTPWHNSFSFSLPLAIGKVIFWAV